MSISRQGRRPWSRRRVAAAAALAGVLVIAACNGDGPEGPTDGPTDDVTSEEPTTDEPSDPSTEEETDDPTADYQQEQIDSAREFVISYYAVVGELGANGFEDWHQVLWPYYAGSPEDLWAQAQAVYSQEAERGIYTSGATEVYSIVASDWTEDPTGSGFDAVTFELCLDSRSVTVFFDDGTEDSATNSNIVQHRYPATAAVLAQPDSELDWSFMALDTDFSQTC